MDTADWVRTTVEAWEGRLVSYACRLLGGDVDRARDVVQDVFLRLWQADRASIEGHEGRWLYAVCRNRAIDVRRKEGRMYATDHGTVEAVGARRGDVGQEPADELARREAPGTLLGLVEALPPRQREAVRLRFQGGLSYADIAAVMETSTSNVGVLLHTAVKALRDRLDPALQPAAVVVEPLEGGAA